MIRKLDKAASERGFECYGLLTTVSGTVVGDARKSCFVSGPEVTSKLDELLRRQQESLGLAVERTLAYNLAFVIDGVRKLQKPSRIGRNEIVQIEHSCGRAPD